MKANPWAQLQVNNMFREYYNPIRAPPNSLASSSSSFMKTPGSISSSSSGNNALSRRSSSSSSSSPDQYNFDSTPTSSSNSSRSMNDFYLGAHQQYAGNASPNLFSSSSSSGKYTKSSSGRYPRPHNTSYTSPSTVYMSPARTRSGVNYGIVNRRNIQF